MSHVALQPGILPAPPSHARFIALRLRPDTDPKRALERLAKREWSERCVLGIGASLAHKLGASVPGLRLFPSGSVDGIGIPSTPAALWLWVRGDDPGQVLFDAHDLTRDVATAFVAERQVDGFRYREGRDLTGYLDGTENPSAEGAIEVAQVSDPTPGMPGSTFVAVQKWHHDLERFGQFAPTERDDIIGRRISDNEELAQAPRSAHVKRTAQEGFAPPAFLLRRSMPWISAHGKGLMFVAFARSFDPFEAQLRRMAGLEDGIVDALFRFTRPVDGDYYWCPPIDSQGRLELGALLG